MKRTATILITLLCLSIGAFGLEITVTAPTVSGLVPAALNTTINGIIAPIVNTTLLGLANAELDKYGNQPKLAEGFANAGTYASHAANHRGLMGYKFLVISAGTMVGLQAPASSEAGLLNALDDLETEGDLYAGAAWQVLSAQVGLNCSFLVDGLYLSVKFGKFTIDYEELSFDSFNIGILADYQLIKPKSLFGIIKWRGLKVGSGIIMETNTTDYTLALPPIEQIVPNIGGSGQSATITLDPSINLGVETSTYTIPIDIVTGIRLLWIANISVGVGADINFGSSEITLGADGITDMDLPELDLIPGATFTPGTITVTGGTAGEGPKFLRPRITASLGVGLGPVKLDVPLTYYFGTEPGLNAGVTLAITL